ncbi:hypothetical protein ACFWC6_33035, partial [Micromonospora chalcea]
MRGDHVAAAEAIHAHLCPKVKSPLVGTARALCVVGEMGHDGAEVGEGERAAASVELPEWSGGAVAGVGGVVAAGGGDGDGQGDGREVLV